MLIVEYTDESGKEIIKDLNEITIKKIIELLDDKSDIKITNIVSEEQSKEIEKEIEKLEDNIVNLEYQLEGRDVEIKELERKTENLEESLHDIKCDKDFEVEELKEKIDKLEKEVEEKDNLIDELEDSSLF